MWERASWEGLWQAHGKKIVLTKVFNSILKLMSNFIWTINKASGGIIFCLKKDIIIMIILTFI